jgi:hypothetical protein
METMETSVRERERTGLTFGVRDRLPVVIRGQRRLIAPLDHLPKQGHG